MASSSSSLVRSVTKQVSRFLPAGFSFMGPPGCSTRSSTTTWEHYSEVTPKTHHLITVTSRLAGTPANRESHVRALVRIFRYSVFHCCRQPNIIQSVVLVFLEQHFIINNNIIQPLVAGQKRFVNLFWVSVFLDSYLCCVIIIVPRC